MQHKYFAIVDIETASDDAALPLLDAEPEARKGLVDPVKIAADIANKKAEQQGRMSLDPYAGRIVCLGYTLDGVEYEQDEASALEEFALALRVHPGDLTCRHLVGFRILGFDLPWLVTRARLLGVPFPTLDTRKYGNRDITDLHSLLTFDGNAPEGAFRRSLQNLARRFGIDVLDQTCGKDIAQMVKDNDFAGIVAHCRSDVQLTYQLAVAVNVVASVRQEQPA
jgi:hypothetical protein